ncbi:methyl-accepting chemotaxis protein [Paraburkholderia nodosa]|uniref:methyl-accepting chemotaxis protein n=1 Tax=Paraburkholderia nodosa TaxID=392320 RepID=UPI00048271BB|nr:methyl-accepting chemotaxis protein [Paraburkholderia nodosa]
MSIRKRVSLLFLCIGMLSFAVALIGMFGMTSASRQSEEMYEEVTLPSQYLEGSYRLQLLMALSIMEAMLDSSDADRQQSTTNAEAFRKASDERFALFNKATKPPETVRIASSFGRDREKCVEALSKVIGLVRGGDLPTAFATIQREVRPAGMAEAAEIESLVSALRTGADVRHQRELVVLDVMRAAMTAIVLIGGLILGLFAWKTLHSLSTGLGDIEATLSDVSKTLNLRRRAMQRREDEIGRTSAAFNALLGRIEAAMETVASATDSLRAATDEIVAGNFDLLSRTDEQASSVEQTSASMIQLTETTNRNAKMARDAADLAVKATDMTNTGDRAVREMTAAIEKISNSSSRIAKITAVIEGIAFQTNILALNAAVEAARAGEQGRGFAVVASEVRVLAQRSAAAAREIKELITASISAIHDGAGKALEVRDAMPLVISSVSSLSDIVREISIASDEQMRGIEEINQAVIHIDHATQQNATLASQTTRVAQSLEMQSLALKDAVSEFKFNSPNEVVI